MKKHIVINIGLETIQGTPVEIHHAIDEIARAGIAILASGVVAGEWEGKTEQTLVVCGQVFDSPLLHGRLFAVASALSQHCIAVWSNGWGELIGPETNFKFDSELFHFQPRN
jgi:hypothetical protein